VGVGAGVGVKNRGFYIETIKKQSLVSDFLYFPSFKNFFKRRITALMNDLLPF